MAQCNNVVRGIDVMYSCMAKRQPKDRMMVDFMGKFPTPTSKDVMEIDTCPYRPPIGAMPMVVYAS